MKRLLPAVAALIGVAALVALGVWQLERRAWKHALIAQVNARLAAPPVAAPGPAGWPAITKETAYTRLSARGVYRRHADTLVQAVTDLGPGYWVMTPMDTGGGWVLLVNRGFVTQDMKGDPASWAPPAGAVTVTGLLRVSEPGGGFLRSNDPAAGRWYSRDVAAIAAARRLGPTAPYFVDADRGSQPGWPRGGLTVVRFSDNHLVYALTWFALAAGLAWVTLWLAVWRKPAAIST